MFYNVLRKRRVQLEYGSVSSKASQGHVRKPLPLECIVCRVIQGSHTVDWFRIFSRKFWFGIFLAGRKSSVSLKVVSP